MSDNTMIIDLGRFTRGKKLLSGRDNGKDACELLELSDVASNCKIVLQNDGDTVITNSYFLGMLSKLFDKYTTKKELLENIDFKQLNDTNQKELLRGINRGFSRAVNAMAV